MWHGVTSWHIYVMVKTLPIWAKLYYKPELLSKKPRGFDRETCSPCGRNVITASFRLVFSSTGNMERHDIRAEI